MSDPLLQRAAEAKRESKYVDFKESFDTTSPEAWCKLLKHMIAMANTGGGVIVFGVDNRGQLSGADLTAVAAIDSATIADKVRSLTGVDFSDFELCDLERDGASLIALKVGATANPLVLSRPMSLQAQGRGTVVMFPAGILFVRHGAKSEPATSEDVRQMIEQRVRSDRADLLRNVRIVARAPRGSAVQVLPQEVFDSSDPDAVPIRVTDDPHAPAYRVIDHNKSHPYGTTKLQQVVNSRLKGTRINWFDLKAVRRVHGIDSRSEFHYVNLYGWSQFSPEYVEWLLAEYAKDSQFFAKARAAEKALDSRAKAPA